MTEINDEEFCLHGIYPKESCTICTGKDRKGKEIAYKFYAKSDYKCFQCKDKIRRNDLVARLNNDWIICPDCISDKENA